MLVSTQVRASLASSVASDQRNYVLRSQLIWLVTAVQAVLNACLLAMSNVAIAETRLPLGALTFVVFGAVALVYTYVRFDARVASFCDSVAVLSIWSTLAVVYTYAATMAGAGVEFWDGRLLAADRALGFNWLAYLAWLNERPSLGWILDQAYLSVLTQLGLLIAFLSMSGQYRRLQDFVLAAQLWMLIGGAAPAVMPAIGAYPHFGADAALGHNNIPLATMNAHVAQVMQLRGPVPSLCLDDVQGIITFPSFHMALAVFFIWGFWTVPIVRWAAIAVNIAMVLATPLSGGHYLVDLLAGGTLAFVAIPVSCACQRVFNEVWTRRSSWAFPPPHGAV